MPIRRHRLLALLLPLTSPAWAADGDQDGIEDTADHCPAAREDVDGDRDWDGCPDHNSALDIDGDGVLNIMDDCPTEPGGHSGCASRIKALSTIGDTRGKAGDADGDGIHDAADRCPLGIEDIDGDRDLDGCPDVVTSADKDGDTVLDFLDKCPSDPGGDLGCPPAVKATPRQVAPQQAPPTGPLTPPVRLTAPTVSKPTHTPPTNHPSWSVIRHRHTHQCHGRLTRSTISTGWFFKCDNGELVHIQLSGAKMPDGVKDGTVGIIHYNPKFSAPLEWNLGWIDIDGGGQIVPDNTDGCFVTTAATVAAGEADDGPTLSTLRRFRDEVLRADPRWSALVDDYYAVAPAIVAAVQERHDAPQVWAAVFEDYLQPILLQIARGHHAAAVASYGQLVEDLSRIRTIS